MRISVYLSDSIINELTSYGPLDEVVDNILQLGETGQIDLEQRPKCKNREHDRRVDIDVTNMYYLELMTHYPPNSSNISLRRLLYWFVENDLCSMLTPSNVQNDKPVDNTLRYSKRYKYIVHIAGKLLNDIDSTDVQLAFTEHLRDAYNILKEA